MNVPGNFISFHPQNPARISPEILALLHSVILAGIPPVIHVYIEILTEIPACTSHEISPEFPLWVNIRILPQSFQGI